MMIARRLFVVPLGNNDHGKTTMLNALLAQGLATSSPGQKGVRELISPVGRRIDAYIFVRSYQEKLKQPYKSVAKALKANDPNWNERDLIILPSHVDGSATDIDEMISLAHEAGFDIISVAVLLDTDKRSRLADILKKEWDERWTVPNPTEETKADRIAQLNALGCDLWMWICKALTP